MGKYIKRMEVKFRHAAQQLLGPNTSTAYADMPQVVAMRFIVQTYDPLRIAGRVIVTRADNHIRRGIIGRVVLPGREPILDVGVVISEGVARETGHRVVYMCHPVLISGLRGDELDEFHVADSRGAEGVELTGAAVYAPPL